MLEIRSHTLEQVILGMIYLVMDGTELLPQQYQHTTLQMVVDVLI
jgi:hypothetical protein